MRDSAALTQLSQQLAQDLDDLPDYESVTDVFDYLTGAIYSLKQGASWRFWNRRGARLPNYKKKIAQYLRFEIPNGTPPNEYWVSGYYLNSAMVRIAACYERIPKMILKRDKLRRGETAHFLMESVLSVGLSCSNWKAVYEEVNKLKHDRSGQAAGRQVSESAVVGALKEIALLLKAKKDVIVGAYREDRHAEEL